MRIHTSINIGPRNPVGQRAELGLSRSIGMELKGFL